MVKKILFAGAVLAGMLSATNVVYAPTISRELFRFQADKVAKIQPNILEKYVKEGNENLKKLEEVIHKREEEQKLLKTDEIYIQINSIYNKSGLNIPKYVTKRFLREIVWLESNDYPLAIGKAGERGLTQMTKEAWYEVEKENFEKNAFIPQKNITASIKYFLSIDKFCRKNYPNWQELPDEEKIRMLVASYNGGREGLRKTNWDISKMRPVTKDYIKNINNVMDSILSP